MEKVFVCVGPNTGDCEMAKLIVGHDSFYFFEPLPEAAAWLREQNKHNAHYVHVVEAACGTEDGEAVLTVYNKRGESSSLGKCSKQATEAFCGVDWQEYRQVPVKVINLCSFMQYVQCGQIETLLIDAQGMDLEILKTMRPYLKRRAIQRVIHEIDADGFRHYDGLPDNSLSAAVEFMQSMGGYEMKRVANRNALNFDIEWTLI
jgi:FkbM family methyltransferase